MACRAWRDSTSDIPPTEDGIRQMVANQSVMCVSQYLNSSTCSTYCKDMTKNYAGCMNCLSSKTTCVDQTDPAKPACCPYIVAATSCNNCMGSSSYQSCLQTGGLTLGQIIGITVGVIIAVLIIGVVIYTIVKSKRSIKQQEKLAKTGGVSADFVPKGLDSGIYATVNARAKILQQSKQKQAAVVQPAMQPTQQSTSFSL